MNASEPAMQPKPLALNGAGRSIKQYLVDYGILLLVAGIILTFDQWTKLWVRLNVPLGGDWLPVQLNWLMPFARIRYWYNSGAAFRIFQDGNLVFTILAIIVAAAILFYYPRTARKDWWLRAALILQFCGATGNLIDRLKFGHVTDFISVGNFAIFNVADASISVGVAVLILGVWISESAEKRRLAAQAAPVVEAELAKPIVEDGPVPNTREQKRG